MCSVLNLHNDFKNCRVGFPCSNDNVSSFMKIEPISRPTIDDKKIGTGNIHATKNILAHIQYKRKYTYQKASPGLDRIVPTMLTHLHPNTVSYFTILRSRILNFPVLPSIWKTALVISILKLQKKNSQSPSLIDPSHCSED